MTASSFDNLSMFFVGCFFCFFTLYRTSDSSSDSESGSKNGSEDKNGEAQVSNRKPKILGKLRLVFLLIHFGVYCVRTCCCATVAASLCFASNFVD